MKFCRPFVLLFIFCTNCASAQLITVKNNLYGINDNVTGDSLLGQRFEKIEQIKFDFRRIYGDQPSLSPLYSCLSKEKYYIFNAYTKTFVEGAYDEIFFSHAFEEQYMKEMKPYLFNAIDAVLLRKGKLWGYIAHKKQYGFHDKLEKTDTFTVISPQYKYLRIIIQENGYDNYQFKRLKRILSAAKDSLYGVLEFETGKTLVPFVYQWPIRRMLDFSVNRGFDKATAQKKFLSSYIAMKEPFSDNRIYINPSNAEISFPCIQCKELSIAYEHGKDFLYSQTLKDSLEELSLYNYNTGEKLFTYKHDTLRSITYNHPHENVLEIIRNSGAREKSSLTWYNISNGEILLYAEKKYFLSSEYMIAETENKERVIYSYSKKRIGTLTGEGASMKIIWENKPLIKKNN